MAHWHVQRHAEDDDIYATDSVFDALGYAATELAIIAESDYELIRVYGESGEYQEAYNAWDRSDRLNVPIHNARNMEVQDRAPVELRAPLYRDPNTSDEYLMTAALHTVEEVNANSPRDFIVSKCYLDPCETLDAGKGE